MTVSTKSKDVMGLGLKMKMDDVSRCCCHKI